MSSLNRLAKYLQTNSLALEKPLPDSLGFYEHPTNEEWMISHPHITTNTQQTITMFELVDTFSHPLIAKVHSLCISDSGDQTEFFSKLYRVQPIFKKFTGVPLAALTTGSNTLSDECVIRLIKDVKELYTFLLSQKIVCSPLEWGLGEATMLFNSVRVTNDGHLKICDYTFWSNPKNELTRKATFIGSMRTPIHKILECSELRMQIPQSSLLAQEEQRHNIFVLKKPFPLHSLRKNNLSPENAVLIESLAIARATEKDVIDYCDAWIISIIKNFEEERLKSVTFVSLRELCLMHTRFLLIEDDKPIVSEDGEVVEQPIQAFHLREPLALPQYAEFFETDSEDESWDEGSDEDTSEADSIG